MSERRSAGSPLRTSGAMYCGVPASMPATVSMVAVSRRPVSSVACWARPKSSSLTCPACVPASVSMMFSGLMSRWRMPLSCAAARAEAGAQSFALDVLHDEIGFAAVGEDVIDGGDAGMVEGGGALSLMQEALA